MPIGETVVLRAEILDKINRPVHLAGEPVYLGQVIYGQQGLVFGQAIINQGQIGQTPVVAFTDSQGVATFTVRGTQAGSDPVYFEANLVNARQFYPYGYSEIVPIRFGSSGATSTALAERPGPQYCGRPVDRRPRPRTCLDLGVSGVAWLRLRPPTCRHGAGAPTSTAGGAIPGTTHCNIRRGGGSRTGPRPLPVGEPLLLARPFRADRLAAGPPLPALARRSVVLSIQDLMAVAGRSAPSPVVAAVRRPGWAASPLGGGGLVTVLLVVNPWIYNTVSFDFHFESVGAAFRRAGLSRDGPRLDRWLVLWAGLCLACGDIAGTYLAAVGIGGNPRRNEPPGGAGRRRRLSEPCGSCSVSLLGGGAGLQLRQPLRLSRGGPRARATWGSGAWPVASSFTHCGWRVSCGRPAPTCGPTP